MPDFLTNYFSGLVESLSSTLKTPDAYLNKIALTATVIVIGLVLHILLKNIITRNVKDFKSKFQLYKLSKQSMVTLTIVAALLIWVQAINALILIILLFGVFVVFMVRGLTNNFIGYFVIKYRRYFEIGHRIEINDIIGDVIDINPINFKLLEVRHGLSADANTGRIIKLPNSMIFDKSIEIIGVVNKFIWHEIKYVLSFESDWQAAEKIMMDVGNIYFNESVLPKLEENNGYLQSGQDKLKPVFSVDTNADGIVVNLRYLVDYRHGTSVKTLIQRNILPQFKDNPQIQFAIVEVKIFRG